MGDILSMRRLENGKVIYKIKVSKSEALSLKGTNQNIFLLSKCDCLHKAKILTRGRNYSTYYFEIPFDLRVRKGKCKKGITYTYYDSSDCYFYVYMIDKDRLEL